jgi:hypothetical protein
MYYTYITNENQMARPKTIDYQRITLSFPKATIEKLRRKIPKNGISKYIAELVEEDVDKHEKTPKEIVDEMVELGRIYSKDLVDKRPSIEIIREMRYEGKY